MGCWASWFSILRRGAQKWCRPVRFLLNCFYAPLCQKLKFHASRPQNFIVGYCPCSLQTGAACLHWNAGEWEHIHSWPVHTTRERAQDQTTEGLFEGHKYAQWIPWVNTCPRAMYEYNLLFREGLTYAFVVHSLPQLSLVPFGRGAAWWFPWAKVCSCTLCNSLQDGVMFLPSRN